MSLAIKFLLALLHGMGGPDLQKWIDDLPGTLGKELGRRIRDGLRQDGTLTPQVQEDIAEWLAEHKEEAGKLFTVLLEKGGDLMGPTDSLIGSYLSLLNAVASIVVTRKASLALRGFFHSSACISYWHFNEGFGPTLTSNIFERHGALERISASGSETVLVYVLDGAPSEDRLVQLNSSIRRADNRQLPYAEYAQCPRVAGVTEFEVTLAHAGLGESVEPIPSGAPGLIEVFSTIPLALRTQRLPNEAFAKTLEAIQVLKSH